MQATPGKRLKIIRKKLNMSQKEFAEKFNMNQAGLSKYENGKLEIPDYIKTLLLNQYKVSINWLLSGKGDMFLENQTGQKDQQLQLLKIISKIDLDDIQILATLQSLKLNSSQKKQLNSIIKTTGEVLVEGGNIKLSQ